MFNFTHPLHGYPGKGSYCIFDNLTVIYFIRQFLTFNYEVHVGWSNFERFSAFEKNVQASLISDGIHFSLSDYIHDITLNDSKSCKDATTNSKEKLLPIWNTYSLFQYSIGICCTYLFEKGIVVDIGCIDTQFCSLW